MMCHGFNVGWMWGPLVCNNPLPRFVVFLLCSMALNFLWVLNGSFVMFTINYIFGLTYNLVFFFINVQIWVEKSCLITKKFEAHFSEMWFFQRWRWPRSHGLLKYPPIMEPRMINTFKVLGLNIQPYIKFIHALANLEILFDITCVWNHR